MSLPSRLLRTDPDGLPLGKIKLLKIRNLNTNSTIDPNELSRIKKLLLKGYSPTGIRNCLVNGGDQNLTYLIQIGKELGVQWDQKAAKSGRFNGNYRNPTGYKHKNVYTKKELNELCGNKKEKHWNWQGGVGPYPDEFNNLIRFLIQVMDNFTCNYCDKPTAEIGHCHVHHIDGNKNNTCADNLCLICKHCHSGQAHKKLLSIEHTLYQKVQNKRKETWPETNQRIKEMLGSERLQTICQNYTTSPLCEFQILERLSEKATYLEKKY